MREVGFAEARVKLKTFVREGAEFIGRGNLILQDEAYHSAAARLCPNGLHLEAAIRLPHIEQGMHNAHLATHTRPIEEVLVLFGREVKEYTIIGFDTINEHVGEAVALILVDGMPVSRRQMDGVFHTVRHDGVHGTQKTVEETRDPKVLLPKAESVVAERCGL